MRAVFFVVLLLPFVIPGLVDYAFAVDTWTDATTTPNLVNKNMMGVSMINANNGVVVGNGGQIVYTSDGGDTWTDATTTNVGTTYMRDVSMVDASNGVAVGKSGKIVYTTNGGVDWTDATTTNVGTTHMRGVSMGDANNGVVVGGSGQIVYTSDGGDTWTDATTTNVGTTNMFDVSMSDASNGVAVGNGGTIVYTTDGGDTWTAATTNVGTNDMRDVSMVDASNGVAVGFAIDVYNDGKIIFTDSSSSEDSTTSSSKSGACGFDRDCTAPRITKHGISETPDGFSINNVIFEENQKRYNENPTVEIGIGELTTIKTRAWENMGPEKIFLAIAYLDMQGTKPDWRDSKAYIEYDIKKDNITIHDENKMFLAQASTEIVKDPYGDNQGLEFLDITFSLMFTKPMETSHVAIQVVDHITNYELVYFKDALKVVDRPISEMPEFSGKIEKANTKPKQDEDIHFVLAVNGTEDTIFAAVDGDAIPLEEMNKEEPKIETSEERDARYHLKAKQSEQYERLLEYIAESQARYPDAWNKIVGSDNVSNQMEHVTDGTKTNVVKNDRRR